jgi:hypothetical protein
VRFRFVVVSVIAELMSGRMSKYLLSVTSATKGASEAGVCVNSCRMVSERHMFCLYCVLPA